MLSDLKSLKPFAGLLIFGNIENLVIGCQGAIQNVNPYLLLICSLIAVSCWVFIGTYGTRVAIKFARQIEFIGGLVIFILGVQTIVSIL